MDRQYRRMYAKYRAIVKRTFPPLLLEKRLPAGIWEDLVDEFNRIRESHFGSSY